jgi:hypothetical protein
MSKNILTECDFKNKEWFSADYNVSTKEEKSWVTGVNQFSGVFYTPFYISIDKEGNMSIDKKKVKDMIHKLGKLL